MQSDKAERITITLPSEMLASIKDKVQSGGGIVTSRSTVRDRWITYGKEEANRSITQGE